MPATIQPVRSHCAFRQQRVAQLGSQVASGWVRTQNGQFDFDNTHKRIFHVALHPQPDVPDGNYALVAKMLPMRHEYQGLHCLGGFPGLRAKLDDLYTLLVRGPF